MPIRKLLVANRGEIALRIFRTCRELGIATVAVAAPDDRGALHARSADETVEIASYLDAEEHLRAARESGTDAIHPGYGFLAENDGFAEAVAAAGKLGDNAQFDAALGDLSQAHFAVYVDLSKFTGILAATSEKAFSGFKALGIVERQDGDDAVVQVKLIAG